MNENAPPSKSVQVQLATSDDLDVFLFLAGKFFEESEQANFLTYDERALAGVFLNSFADEHEGKPAGMHTAVVYVMTGPNTRVPAGFVSVTFDRSHSVEPVASIHFIYALPETRKTAIGRMLMDAAVQLAKLEGAPILMAGAITGVPAHVKTVNNLFRKFGFQESGSCFVRFLKGD